MQRLTISCSKCLSRIRAEILKPTTTVPAFKYCGLCGSDKVGVSQDMELDYWETLAAEFNVPVPLIKQIYDAWDHREHNNFGDFFRSLEV